MEEYQRVVPVWVSIVMLILLLGAMGNYIVCTLDAGPKMLFSCIMVIITSVFAWVYCVTGYKKNRAAYFKYFCYALLLMFLIGGWALNESIPALLMCLRTISFGSLAVIAFALDLGKAKSTIFSLIMVVSSLIELGHFLFAVQETLIPAVFIDVVMSIIMFIMVKAKYADKKRRGTK